jgi:hypothetical protein
VTAYDATTAAGLANAQPFPSINCKDDVQMDEDGSVTLYSVRSRWTIERAAAFAA